MKTVVIIGSGAVAAELTSYIEDNNNHLNKNQKFDIRGYIDYDFNKEIYWDKYNFKKPIICNIDEYDSVEGESVLIGVSDIPFRNQIIEKLLNRNINIESFVHHSSIISDSTNIGIGNIIYPFCIIGPNTNIGDFNVITSYSFISHDCKIGNGNFFSTAGLAGRIKVGNNNFFGIRSTVIPKVQIGNNNIIQAGMVVDKDIEDEVVVFYRFKEKILAIPKK